MDSVTSHLKSLSTPKAVAGMARFGIVTKKAYGISTPVLRKLARELGKDHHLAKQLWSTGIFEARVLAAFIDQPAMVSEQQMDKWVKDFDNWAICDASCGNLFDRTPFAWKKAREWSGSKEEFVKRAGFSLMAELAVHDKDADNKKFLNFLPIIKRGATDERNFVEKAVNWALRQIGKRNLNLNKKAIETAREIQKLNSPSAKWIASDALRELRSESVLNRFRRKKLKVTFGSRRQPSRGRLP